jgi:hypothetical protein
MSITQQFTVIVRDVLSDFALSFGSTNVLGGESNNVPLVLKSSLPLTNLTLHLTTSSSALSNLALRPLNSEVTLASLSPSGSNSWSLNLNLDPNQQTDPTRSIVALDFLALSNEHSAIVLLVPSQLLAGQSAGAAITNGAGIGGRVIVVNNEPVLDIASGAPLSLTLYGQPGSSYSISSSINLLSGPWTVITNIALTNRSASLPVTPTIPTLFFRAQKQ